MLNLNFMLASFPLLSYSKYPNWNSFKLLVIIFSFFEYSVLSAYLRYSQFIEVYYQYLDFFDRSKSFLAHFFGGLVSLDVSAISADVFSIIQRFIAYTRTDDTDAGYPTLSTSFIFNFICVVLFLSRTCGTCLLHGAIYEYDGPRELDARSYSREYFCSTVSITISFRVHENSK